MSSTQVQDILQEVWQNTGAQSVMILSLEGRIVREIGTFSPDIDKGVLGALLGHGMAAFYEISGLSEENDIEQAFFYYQGSRLEFACTGIDEHYFLAAIYTSGAETFQTSLGLIWHYSKHACEQLRHLFLETTSPSDFTSHLPLSEDDIAIDLDTFLDFSDETGA